MRESHLKLILCTWREGSSEPLRLLLCAMQPGLLRKAAKVIRAARADGVTPEDLVAALTIELPFTRELDSSKEKDLLDVCEQAMSSLLAPDSWSRWRDTLSQLGKIVREKEQVKHENERLKSLLSTREAQLREMGSRMLLLETEAKKAVAIAKEADKREEEQRSEIRRLMREIENLQRAVRRHSLVGRRDNANILPLHIRTKTEAISGVKNEITVDLFQPIELVPHKKPLGLTDINELLDRLREVDSAAARLVVFRFFGGLTLGQIAERLGVTEARVLEDWTRAKEWLTKELGLGLELENPEAQQGRIRLVGPIASLSLVDPQLLKEIKREPELIKALHWRDFEKVLARLLSNLGYEIELTQGTKDGGIDIVAFKRYDNFGPHYYVLQAKRWANAVGVEPVEQLLFLQSRIGATKGCLATTSHFTKGAWRLASEYQWQLELRDFERLREWIVKGL